MKVQLTIKKEYDVKYLRAKVGARYWEDAEVNGFEDTDGILIPCRDGEYWEPIIDVETGVIINWEKGKIASVHYKCCDDGYYTLLDANMNVIKSIKGYVPDIMCPNREGYGDYVKMDIDADGKIKKWKPSFDEFDEANDL